MCFQSHFWNEKFNPLKHLGKSQYFIVKAMESGQVTVSMAKT